MADSWWDSFTGGLSDLWGGIKNYGGQALDYIGDNKNVQNALVAGGLGLYDAYNKNQANKKVSSALQASEAASAADAADYQNYLNVLAQWQAANPSTSSGGGGGYGYSRGYPYVGELKSMLTELKPFTKMTVKNARAGSKAYRKALKELGDLDVSVDVAPAYSLDTGIGDMIKKAKKQDGNK